VTFPKELETLNVRNLLKSDSSQQGNSDEKNPGLPKHKLRMPFDKSKPALRCFRSAANSASPNRPSIAGRSSLAAWAPLNGANCDNSKRKISTHTIGRRSFFRYTYPPGIWGRSSYWKLSFLPYFFYGARSLYHRHNCYEALWNDCVRMAREFRVLAVADKTRRHIICLHISCLPESMNKK
jgi:hypothetical protein